MARCFDKEQIAEEEGRPIYRFSTDSPLRSMTGRLDELALFAAQVAGQVREIANAKTVVEQIVNDAERILRRLAT